jgi:hypothetical protein
MGDYMVDADAPIKDAPSLDTSDPEVMARAQAAEDHNRRQGRVRDVLYPEDDGSIDAAIRESGAADPYRQLAHAGYEAIENPEDFSIGAAQGFMSNMFDDAVSGLAGAYEGDPSAFVGGESSGMLRMARPDMFGDEESIDRVRTEVDDEVDQRIATAQERSPAGYGAGHAAGGLAQAAAVPIPGVSGLPWYARLGGHTLEAATMGGLGAAGDAEDGERLDAFGEGALEAAPYGLLGFGLGTAGDMMSRSPGATRGMAEFAGRQGDDARLDASGIRGPAARRQLDERYGGAGVGRREFARELRERHVGERFGIPMPGPALDDAFEMRASVGPDIGNPLAGPLRSP